MDFTAPQPLTDVLAQLDAKTPVGSVMRSADWESMPQQLRDSAFFSAGVTDAAFLAQQQAAIRDMISRARETNAAGDSMWKMGRSQFVKQLRQMGEAAGIAHPDGREGGINEKDITDPISIARLKLVVNTQLEMAYGQGQYLAAMDEDILSEWPAWELVRITPRKAPRDWIARWQAAGGTLHEGRMIALKTDPIWTAISRFGKPHPPFDYNSGMGVEEVDRDTAEHLGLMSMTVNEALHSFSHDPALKVAARKGRLVPDAPSHQAAPKLSSLEDGLEASVKDLDADMRERLRNVLGGQVAIDSDTAKWKPYASHDSPEDRPQDGTARNTADSDAQRTRLAVEKIFSGVFRGWDSKADPAAAAIKSGIVGQIAAAAHGLKPLYFDAWGDEAAAIAQDLRQAVPAGTQVLAKDGGLMVWRDEAVQPLLSGKGGIPQQIMQAVDSGNYGVLLGYGLPNTKQRPAMRVRIFNGESQPVIQFNAPVSSWQDIASARVLDLTRTTGREDLFVAAEELP